MATSRTGRAGREGRATAAKKGAAKKATPQATGGRDEGSLIGRRVGRGRANLERALERPEKERRDALVDTSLPGVSASDRKAGYGSTAARNTRRRAPRAVAALEDSATGKPSRKSTRKSAQRAKQATQLTRKARRATAAPKARAQRAAARGRG